MRARPTPILTETAPRELPIRDMPSLRNAPGSCVTGAIFVDELFRDHRISSVEWLCLRQAIWPVHSATGEELLVLRGQPSPLSVRTGA